MDKYKQRFFDQASSGIAVTNLQGDILTVNQQFGQITLADHSQNIQAVFGDALPVPMAQIITDLLHGHRLHVFEIRHEFEPKQPKWCIVKIWLMQDDEQPCLCFVVDDLTANRHLNPRMNIHLNAVIDRLPVLIAQLDGNNCFLYANKAYEDFFNTTLNQVVGQRVDGLIGQEAYRYSEPYIDRARAGETVSFDNTLFFDNELKVLHIILLPAEDIEGHIYVFAQDVTDLRSFQRSLELKAYHDSLTGLPNRHLFMRTLTNILKYKQTHSALLFIDMDGMKPANDQYGHQVGDELLKAFSQVLRDSVRPQDFVSRLAGDEFTIILTELDEPLSNTAEICQRILDRLPQEVTILGHQVPCSCSIGAVVMDVNRTMTKESWLAKADAAMYKAKNKGKGVFVLD